MWISEWHGLLYKILNVPLISATVISAVNMGLYCSSNYIIIIIIIIIIITHNTISDHNQLLNHTNLLLIPLSPLGPTLNFCFDVRSNKCSRHSPYRSQQSCSLRPTPEHKRPWNTSCYAVPQNSPVYCQSIKHFFEKNQSPITNKIDTMVHYHIIQLRQCGSHMAVTKYA